MTDRDEREIQGISAEVAARRPSRALMRAYCALAPALAARTFERLYMTPAQPAGPTRERKLFAEAEAVRLPYGGEPYGGRWLDAWAWGAGPPVLLLHGWAGRGAQMGVFVRPLIEAGLRPVIADAPGHGANAGGMTSLVDYAGFVIQLAGRFGPPAGVVAHSLGAMAAGVALEAGMLAERLVFIAPPRSLDPSTRDWARALGFSEAVRRRMMERVAAGLGLPWTHFDLVERVRDLRAPLLVVHDRNDSEASFTGGREVAEAAPNGRLHATEGLGHRRILMSRTVASLASGFIAGAG